ncbi:MAG: T9SS type A sorting domain-containing protein [Candidatus Kapabacteria bacterium]|nr:T9SS type A sorting domain-containing protein [Candidatus Kapabacteria bacterium]
MKKFLFFLGVFLIMQTLGLISNDDIVWIKQTHDVKYVQFSPDSKLIATNNNGQVLIHDVETQETLFEYNPILQTRFTPDGKYLVGYFNTKELILIDMATRQRKENIQPAPSGILFYDISSDGKKIIASYDQKYEYSIWDIESGQIERTVVFHPDDTANTLWMDISRIHFGKDDKTIIYTRRKAIPAPGPELRKIYSSTHIIDAETGVELRKVNNGGMLNFSHDKSIVTERYVDTKLAFRVFKVNNWELLWSVPGPLDLNLNYLGQIAFSPDDKYVIAGYGMENRRISVYDVLNGEEKYSYKTEPVGGYFDAVDVSNDGKYIAGGNGEQLILFDFDFLTSVTDDIPLLSGLNSYPNPSNTNSITFEFNLLNSGETKIQLFDLTGRIVKNIENKFLEAGNHNLEIDISNLPIGQYNLTIETITGIKSHKILVSR